MKSLVQTVNEAATQQLNEASSKYVAIHCINGEDLLEKQCTYDDLTNPKWILDFVFGNEDEHMPLAEGIIKLIKSNLFKREQFLMLQGDAGYVVFANKDNVFDMYNL